jgi:predicted membrane metal-binding protein
MKRSISAIWLAGLLLASSAQVGCAYLVAGTAGAVLVGVPVAALAVLLFLSFAATFGVSGSDTDEDAACEPEDAAFGVRLAYEEPRRLRRQARVR